MHVTIVQSWRVRSGQAGQVSVYLLCIIIFLGLQHMELHEPCENHEELLTDVHRIADFLQHLGLHYLTIVKIHSL